MSPFSQMFVTPKHKSQGRAAGFTMVELLVSIGLFSILVSIAVGGFARALRTQRQTSALLAANSNASLTLEQMAREIRTGYDFCVAGSSTACGTEPGRLVFHNAESELVSYCFIPGNGQNPGRIERGIGPVGGCGTYPAITGTNVSIAHLDFLLVGAASGDLYPPRITITLGVTPRESGLASTTLNMQTTVSSRILDG